MVMRKLKWVGRKLRKDSSATEKQVLIWNHPKDKAEQESRERGRGRIEG